MTRLAELGEWGLIAALKSRFGHTPEGFVGIGDDTAVGTIAPGLKALTTVDMLVEDVHFRRHTISPQDLGHKALAVNLSDIASMGGTPRWAVLGLSLPGDLDAEWVLGFYDGLAELAASTGTLIAGGDTVGSPGPITIAITVIGEVDRPLLRTGARAGDRLFITGPAGASAAGFWCIENPDRAEELLRGRGYIKAVLQAHRRPIPQLAAGKAAQQLGIRVAMLDNSDGIARSALILAEGNGLDICLDQAALPLDEATRAVAAAAGIDPSHWALYGGEDYNLIGTVAPEDWPSLERALASAGTSPALIGELLNGPGRVRMRGPDQQLHELAGESGFEHFGA